MHAMVLMLAVLLVLAIAYRYYSAFLAAKVMVLDDSRETPAHRLKDGQNYHPTNKWVLFGHHFAAISGAGPLLGPVLAAQFGYLPGLLWILVGVCLAGAVQDFVVLVLSTRRNGKSLAQLAREELGRIPGQAATIGILFVLVIALAGLGKAVVKALGGEDVSYPTGTKLIWGPGLAEPKVAPAKGVGGWSGLVYTVPVGTRVVYPKGGEETVHLPFELEISATDQYKPVEAAPTEPALGAPWLDLGTDRDAASVASKPKVVDVDLRVEGSPFAGMYFSNGIQLREGVTAVRRISGSRWGLFSIALTIPIALFTGLWMYKIRKGKVLEASIIGGLLTLGAVWAGAFVEPGGALEGVGRYFNLSESGVAWSMAVYGFVASVLPVWVLLCPRDYLSSFLKIGTVSLLVVGVIVANPVLQAPAVNAVYLGGGPTVKGSIFPFLFITIMCGAISGFHALVSSGTTPKMVSKESQTRMIGYGAMLIEGLVGIVALIAACSLPRSHYYQMNTAWADLPRYAQVTGEYAKADAKEFAPLGDTEKQVGASLQGRTGGAVTLAVGMAEIFDRAARNIMGLPEAKVGAAAGGSAEGPGGAAGGAASPGVGEKVDGVAAKTLEKLEGLVKYWFYFAIMFEALFIMTTIDTGTRVGRFLLQETLGAWVHPKFGKTDWWPGAVLATGAIVAGWFYFINMSGSSFAAIWAMFGVSNQMLAVWALAVATVALVRSGKGKYAWVTGLPMVCVAVTTTSAAVMLMIQYGQQMEAAKDWGARVNPMISFGLIGAIVACTVVILAGAVVRVGEVRRKVAVAK